MTLAASSAQPLRARSASRPLRSESSGWVPFVAYALAAGLFSVVWFLRAVPDHDHWLAIGTMATAVVGNASCAIVGCYLVLRRMSLLGDAISHSVLPGIALAFIFTGEISGLAIVFGAMALGIVTSVLSHSLHWFGKVSEDASMGVVYTTLFALGVILLQVWAAGTHLDADCVLYGQIDIVGLDQVRLAGLSLPRALVTLSAVLGLTVGFVALLWKELKIVAFDPALAAAMGIRVLVVHYALMAAVAGVAVAAFESVGSILVVAMLVIPPASAHLMSDRLRQMLAWSVLFGAVSGVVGYLAAVQWNTTASGMMAVVAAVQLVGAVLLAPRHGWASRWLRNLQLSLRIASEDVIGQLYRAEEARSQHATDAGAENFLRPQVRTWLQRLAWWRLRQRGFIASAGAGQLALTSTGTTAARALVRAHRLWETYLDTHFDLPRDHLHEPAERMEHFLDPQLQADLDAELADRRVDPHGKAIPRDER